MRRKQWKQGRTIVRSIHNTALALTLATAMFFGMLPVQELRAEESKKDQAATAAEGIQYERIDISTAEQFADFASKCYLDSWSENKYVSLKADIDLTGTEIHVVPVFNGIFDGVGHTISGFDYVGDGYVVGLFRYVESQGLIQNLTLKGNIASENQKECIGSICGVNYGTIKNCTFQGTVSGRDTVGGIAGINGSTGMISGCAAKGRITGYYSTGGVAGINHGTLNYCSNRAGINDNSEWVEEDDEMGTGAGILESLTGGDDSELYSGVDTGGIAGFSDGVIVRCTNSGTVGYEHTGYNIGGIVGRQSGVVSLCNNNGTVYGRKDIGGIVGQMEPFIEINEAESLKDAVDKLHDLIDKTINDMQATKNGVKHDFDVLMEFGDGAVDAADVLAEQIGDFVDDNLDQAQALSDRVDHVMEMTPGVLNNFEAAENSFTNAVNTLRNVSDSLGRITSVGDEAYDASKDKRITLLHTVGGYIISDSYNPKAGEEVTITAVTDGAEEAYQLSTVKVVKVTDGSEVAVSKKSDSDVAYTFEMPAENVRVEAYFEPKEGISAGDENEIEIGTELETETDSEEESEDGTKHTGERESEPSSIETKPSTEPGTDTPGSTETPDRTESADSSGMPGSTETPDRTESAESPENPGSTETPDRTESAESPENPGTPGSTETPDSTESASGPETPGSTETPDSTESADSPEGTDTPESTGAPAGTADAENNSFTTRATPLVGFGAGAAFLSGAAGSPVIKITSNLSGNASCLFNDSRDRATITVEPSGGYTVNYVNLNGSRISADSGNSYAFPIEAEQEYYFDINFKKVTTKSGAADNAKTEIENAIREAQDAANKINDKINNSGTISVDELQKMLSATTTVMENTEILAEIYGDQAADSLRAVNSDLGSTSDNLKSALDAVKSATRGTRDIADYMNAQPDINFTKLGAVYDYNRINLNNYLQGISDSLQNLSNNASGYSDVVNADLKAVNDQVNVVFNLLADRLTGAQKLELSQIYEDAGDEDIDAITTGRAESCRNKGFIKGDINVGGIAGSMAIDDEDFKDSAAGAIEYEIGRRYITKCLVTASVNEGYVTSKKNGAGGICGYMNHGIIVDSESYGSVESTEGDYVGGICGESLTIITSCYALCSVSGNKNVGGIAGYADTLKDCYSMADVHSENGRAGAIAGQVSGQIAEYDKVGTEMADSDESDEPAELKVSGNYYVGEGVHGIDDISYMGVAEPISYADLLAVEQLPAQFWHLKVIYKIEDTYLGSEEVKYGEKLDKLNFPQIPGREGFYGEWPDVSDMTMNGTIVVEAQYKDNVTVVQSDKNEVIADEGQWQKPYALVEDVFTEDTVLNVKVSDKTPPQEAAEKQYVVYEVILENGGIKETDSFSLRILNPYEEAVVYGYRDGTWTALESKSRGQYMQVDMMGTQQYFCVVENTSNLMVIVACAAAGVVVLILVVVLFKKGRAKRRQKRQKKAEEANPSTDPKESGR